MPTKKLLLNITEAYSSISLKKSLINQEELFHIVLIMQQVYQSYVYQSVYIVYFIVIFSVTLCLIVLYYTVIMDFITVM